MAKKKLKLKESARKVTLSDGRIFVGGDELPNDVKKLDLDALYQMELIEE